MITCGFNLFAGTRYRFEHVLDETEIELLILRNVILEIHLLNAEIDSLDRRVRGFRRQDVLLAQDRRITIDQECRTVLGIGDDALADHDSFERLQLDSEGHFLSPMTITVSLATASLPLMYSCACNNY